MQTILWLICAGLAAIVAAIHVLSVIFSDKRSTILNFVNIALHIALVFVMLYAQAPLEAVTLAFMCSLLIYVLAFWIKGRVGKGGTDK
jgi:hypothetical protein